MPRERDKRSRGKHEDLAIIIPAFGAILLMPLVANLFVIRETIFGVPLEIAYLFGIWLFLVAGAVFLSFRLPFVSASARGAREEAERDKKSGAR